VTEEGTLFDNSMAVDNLRNFRKTSPLARQNRLYLSEIPPNTVTRSRQVVYASSPGITGAVASVSGTKDSKIGIEL
jgi:hypothetical protein